MAASLVLHYLEDSGPTLTELQRVLRPGGRLIASVSPPLSRPTRTGIPDPRPDYYATTRYTFGWTLNGQSGPMELWRRPLHAMTDAFTTVGFRLCVISEPQPEPAARELFSDGFKDLSTNPNLLFFVAEVPPSATGSGS